MKTTKKGFTLIELIVVIAIIGVLAAILVPSMLGYVRKSKISSANSTASSIYKAINSALTELDEEGVDIAYNGYIKIAAASRTVSTGEVVDLESTFGEDGDFGKKIERFFNDITRVKGDTFAYIDGGTCVAVGVATDKTYTGTYPTGVITNETYKLYQDSAGAKSACGVCIDKLGITASSNDD